MNHERIFDNNEKTLHRIKDNRALNCFLVIEQYNFFQVHNLQTLKINRPDSTTGKTNRME